MKINEITDDLLLSYLNAYQEDLPLIKMFKDAAVSYIQNYTKLTSEKMMLFDDITIAVLALTSHFFENRSMETDKSSLNLVIDSILKLHDSNW